MDHKHDRPYIIDVIIRYNIIRFVNRKDCPKSEGPKKVNRKAEVNVAQTQLQKGFLMEFIRKYNIYTTI